MIEIVREDDGELCGFVAERADGWHALTVFGGRLGIRDTADDAENLVRERGLSSLMERWLLVRPDGEEQIVCIQEASPQGVTLALDYYSMPGVPTLRVERATLDAGDLSLVLR